MLQNHCFVFKYFKDILDDDIFIRAGAFATLTKRYLHYQHLGQDYYYVSKKFFESNTFSKTCKIGIKFRPLDLSKRPIYYVKFHPAMKLLYEAILYDNDLSSTASSSFQIADNMIYHNASPPQILNQTLTLPANSEPPDENSLSSLSLLHSAAMSMQSSNEWSSLAKKSAGGKSFIINQYLHLILY